MKTLETPDLLLRGFTMEDAGAVQRYAGNPENVVYMPWGPNTMEETQAFIEESLNNAAQTPCRNYQFAAVLKETGELCGGCGITLSGDEAEIGWIVRRDLWNRGLCTQMGRALLAFGFDGLNLHRIIARCDAENTASLRVMEKIGMRKEGVFLDARPAHKKSPCRYSDEIVCAMLKDEWDIQREIAQYNALPVAFEGFNDVPELYDGVIRLVCVEKVPANPGKNWVPAYHFAVCLGSGKIGGINLRLGYGGGPHNANLYYGGQIGYEIDERFRGKGYAVRACRLLVPVAKAHGMEKLLITNDRDNQASRRVCEKLGARHIRLARVPQWHDLHTAGVRFVNIFEWNME